MKHLILLLLCFSGYHSFAEDTIPASLDTIIAVDNVAPTINADTFAVATVAEEMNTTVATTATEMPAKKKKFNVDRVRILIGFNYSFYNPVVTEKDIFRGSYYPVKDSTPVWTERETKVNLAKIFKTGNIQFNLQANFWKGLFFGMNYQFSSVRKYKKDPNLGNLLSRNNAIFFVVSAQVGYVFEFLKNKALQIHPSIRIGGYSADDYYDSGLGRKFYFGTDLQIRYLIKRKAGFSLGVDYDFLHYKKKGYSDIFQRDTYQKTTISNVHLNAGVYVNISINTKK